LPDIAVSVILVVVGLVNFAPVTAMVSSRALARAYGIDEPSGDLAVLLRHRALLFGALGGFIIVSAFFPSLQVAAVIMAYICMVGFVMLAASSGTVGAKLTRVRNIDIGAIVLLSIVPVVWMFFSPVT